MQEQEQQLGLVVPVPLSSCQMNLQTVSLAALLLRPENPRYVLHLSASSVGVASCHCMTLLETERRRRPETIFAQLGHKSMAVVQARRGTAESFVDRHVTTTLSATAAAAASVVAGGRALILWQSQDGSGSALDVKLFHESGCANGDDKLYYCITTVKTSASRESSRPRTISSGQ